MAPTAGVLRGRDRTCSGQMGQLSSTGECVGQEQRRGRAGDVVVPAASPTRVRGNSREDKQSHQGMLLRGMQPTTASRTFLLTDEFKEAAESIQSHTIGLFFLK